MDFHDIDALIFDLDGTLYDKKNIVFNTMTNHWREIPILHATNQLRKTLKGVDLKNAEEFHKYFFGKIAEASGRSVKKVESWYLERFYPRFIATLQKKYQARQGMDKLLSAINKRIPAAVFSDYSFVAERLQALKIPTDVFDVLAGSEEFGVLKPASRPLIELAGRMGVEPKKVLVVGDRRDTDGEAARMAGMMFYHITGDEAWNRFISDMIDYLNKRGDNG